MPHKAGEIPRVEAWGERRACACVIGGTGLDPRWLVGGYEGRIDQSKGSREVIEVESRRGVALYEDKVEHRVVGCFDFRDGRVLQRGRVGSDGG